MEQLLYLIWKDPKTRRNYTVGKLEKNNGYSFEYYAEAANAKEAGWKGLGAFPEKKKYESDILFPVFSSRLPDRKRRDIDSILKKYGLSEYDEFNLLKMSRAKLPIDTYELIDPIFPDDTEIEREFYLMGTRHYALCDGKNCVRFYDVSTGDFLTLKHEPNNEFDPSAVRVSTFSGDLLGYVPRYYSEAVSNRLLTGMTYTCAVIEVNKNGKCAECVKVRLNMPKVQ